MIQEERFLEIPQRMIGQGSYFAMRVAGDSMKGAGINDCDIVIIRMQNHAENGQIVVARLDQDVTLKRYFLEKIVKKAALEKGGWLLSRNWKRRG